MLRSVQDRHPRLAIVIALLLASSLMMAMPGARLVVASQGATPEASPEATPVSGELAEIPMGGGADNPNADPNATLTFNLGNEITTGDPQILAFLNEIEIASKVFTPLLALTSENEVASAGAESMNVSDDGTVYTFTIRSGMAYTDGQAVTAGDYAYAIKRACSPVVNGDYSNILFVITGCQEWRQADVEADSATLPDLEAAVDEAIMAIDDQT
ncbi:MAG: ABC transporter substrate-binding protein, partial [Thermomicrobiales bacterium]